MAQEQRLQQDPDLELELGPTKSLAEIVLDADNKSNPQVSHANMQNKNHQIKVTAPQILETLTAMRTKC